MPVGLDRCQGGLGPRWGAHVSQRAAGAQKARLCSGQGTGACRERPGSRDLSPGGAGAGPGAGGQVLAGPHPESPAREPSPRQ